MKEFLDLEPETWALYESVKEKFNSKCQKIDELEDNKKFVESITLEKKKVTNEIKKKYIVII